MRRLATGPIDRVPDHFDTNWEKLQYLRSRAQRLSNKLLGRPATPETAILASMVSQLLEATQTWLGDSHCIDAVVLSSPDRIRLNDEELGDIFDYLKLRNLMIDGPRSIYQLYATSAAYAGYGKGLCRTYTDAYACEHEEAQLPHNRVLQLDLNSKSLSGTWKTLQSANGGLVEAQFVDFELGSAREGMAPEGDEYWAVVFDRVREFVESLADRVYMPRVTELLLTGPAATERGFQIVVREALYGLVADESVLAPLESSNVTADSQVEWESLFSFATARGAAEMAKRRQEGPVGCGQSDECRRRRDSVHGERGPTFMNQQPDT